jgi:hypothetical protein
VILKNADWPVHRGYDIRAIRQRCHPKIHKAYHRNMNIAACRKAMNFSKQLQQFRHPNP